MLTSTSFVNKLTENQTVERILKICRDMIASTQITNTVIFAFITVLAFKLLSRKVLFINKRQQKLLQTKLLFKKIANFTGTLSIL